jgi:hypothetical protein
MSREAAYLKVRYGHLNDVDVRLRQTADPDTIRRTVEGYAELEEAMASLAPDELEQDHSSLSEEVRRALVDSHPLARGTTPPSLAAEG